MIRTVWAIPLVVFLGLVAIFALQLTSGRDVSEVPSALIGRPAPQVALEPLEGPQFTLTPGRPQLVNVFASWCGPCRVEHPELERLAAQGVPIHAINYKDAPANARAFLAQLGNPFATIGADPNGRAAIEWGVYGVPETFLVDAQGRIRHRIAGPLDREKADDLLARMKAL